jgi:hypothetical protein
LGVGDCELIAVRFEGRDYIKVVAFGGGPAIPSEHDRPVVFNFSTLQDGRSGEFTDAVEKSISDEPLRLTSDRSEADNVIVGRASMRYSLGLKVWEKIVLNLTTRSARYNAGQATTDWIMTTTARLNVWITEENVDKPHTWHEPNEPQRRAYAVTLVEAVKQQLQGVCTSGGRRFTANYGPVIDFTCR